MDSPAFAFNFNTNGHLTLGVEIELQLLDAESLNLTPASPLILELAGKHTDRVKAEIFQSMLEINTSIQANAHEVRQDLEKTLDVVEKICKKLNIRLASAGTHPFAHYSDRLLYPAERYHELIDRNKWIARRLMIFGIHVHVGLQSGERAVAMNNALLHYLPILLALSCSSPYWSGEDTELASSRITFFEALPTGGHPCRVTSWEQFENLYKKLVRSGAIESIRDIWWDIRFRPDFGTLEIRICDGLPTLDEVAAMTALIHSLCLYLDDAINQGAHFDPPSDWIIRENKWRASRWGLDGRLIQDEYGNTQSLRDIFSNLLKTLRPFSKVHNYEAEFRLIENVIKSGTSCDRQRLAFNRHHGDLKEVARHLALEFEKRTPQWNPK